VSHNLLVEAKKVRTDFAPQLWSLRAPRKEVSLNCLVSRWDQMSPTSSGWLLGDADVLAMDRSGNAVRDLCVFCLYVFDCSMFYRRSF
jgi:hypothetical protein